MCQLSCPAVFLPIIVFCFIPGFFRQLMQQYSFILYLVIPPQLASRQLQMQIFPHTRRFNCKLDQARLKCSAFKHLLSKVSSLFSSPSMDSKACSHTGMQLCKLLCRIQQFQPSLCLQLHFLSSTNVRPAQPQPQWQT
eukprot:Pompholyxophrys_punicea_v1_NODE_420_length_2008_cov_4.910906.p3 type:complete len:138 gc:universal NODE_420_length_2008_cov_4.910906:1491-1078(-)